MNIQIIENVLNELLITPRVYHYRCHAGSTVGPFINETGSSPVYHCDSAKPDGGYINGPMCKKCDGVVYGEFVLSDREQSENYHYKRFADKLIEKLKPENLTQQQ